MNKQTFLLPAIRLTAVNFILYILPIEITSQRIRTYINFELVDKFPSRFDSSLAFYQIGVFVGFFVLSFALFLIFAINPELMWFRLKDVNKKQSKELFEIGMTIIGVYFAFSQIHGFLRSASYSSRAIPFPIHPVFSILIAISFFIIIRAKIVLPKLLKA